MSTAIQTALANFQTLALKDAARQLLAKLGYQSDKFLVGAGSRPQDFLADFASGHLFESDFDRMIKKLPAEGDNP